MPDHRRWKGSGDFLKQHKKIRSFLLLVLLCVCLLAVWAVMHRKGSSQSIAEIVYQGKVIRTVDLASVKTTETFTVGEPGEQNTIQISPDGIGVIEADCKDQICVRQGIRAHGPEPIVCLPHKLSIRFSDSGQADGADGSPALDAVTGR